jgi:2,4-dienoyl-CoA reductase-like NADH-dependent reductase (Old Yellow Enzyme family)
VPFGDWPTPNALTVDEIGQLTDDFAAAARRAVRIGFPVIELHAAHGYLMHQFLSPLSNRREDDYGGSLENRMRLPLEVFAAIRAVLPEDTVLGVRVSATDWVDGGWTPEETVTFSVELKALGCDFMDVSSGGNDPAQQIPLAPGYQVPFAEKVKKEVGIPTMAVGMITKPRQAEAVVASGQADMVALARGMMFDPRWAWHAAEALGADTPYADNYGRCHPSRWPHVFPWAEAAE